jgi:hypothetical protein
MKRSIQFVPAALAVASLTLVLLAADASAQVRKPGRDVVPTPIDWELRVRHVLPIGIYSSLPTVLFDRRKPFLPIEEWHPLGVQEGRAGW